MPERLQKLIAAAGMGSRRQVEGWIAEGRVAVNGTTATLGDQASHTDKVTVDGRAVRLAAPHAMPCRVLMYKKHADQIVTRKDPEGRQTVFRGLPRLETGRWMSVGRLDINTSGLLLMTTDGELKGRLEHPSYELDREYAVRVHGPVDDAMLERLVNGVELEDGPARFEQIDVQGGTGSNQWFNVTLREGRYRVVRRLWASQGVEVSRLVRIRFGPVPLMGGIKAGGYKEMTPAQVTELARAVDLKR